MSRKLTISPDTAFTDYLTLGHSRSLRGLHQLYAGSTSNAPSLDTLRSWSKKFGWQERLAEQDARARQSFDETTVKETAQQRQYAVTALRDGARDLLSTLTKKLGDIKIETGRDVQACAEAIVSLVKAAEVLDGRVSDRQEQMQPVLSPEEVRRRANEKAGAMVQELAARIKSRSDPAMTTSG